MKTKVPDLEKTKVLELLVEGVPVSVNIDEHGRPLSTNAGAWLGGDKERITRLAMYAAETGLRHSADQRRKAAGDATRTAKSAKTRRKAAKKHSSIKWLEAAHQENPKFGAERLMVRARQIFAAKRRKISAKKRKEIISEYRAREYLKAIRRKKPSEV